MLLTDHILWAFFIGFPFTVKCRSKSYHHAVLHPLALYSATFFKSFKNKTLFTKTSKENIYSGEKGLFLPDSKHLSNRGHGAKEQQERQGLRGREGGWILKLGWDPTQKSKYGSKAKLHSVYLMFLLLFNVKH